MQSEYSTSKQTIITKTVGNQLVWITHSVLCGDLFSVTYGVVFIYERPYQASHVLLFPCLLIFFTNKCKQKCCFLTRQSVYEIVTRPKYGGRPLMTLNIAGNTGYNCNFEQNICPSWVQDKTDTFDWTRQQGQTASSTTGPSVDHTTGTSKSVIGLP